MKVIRVSLIPLLASILLLPSEARAQRDTNVDSDEGLVRRRRSMTLEDYFTGPENLAKICILCEDFFEINFHDCNENLNGGKQSCKNYVKGNRAVIVEGWNTFAATEVPTGDQYFLPENLAKTCKICDDLFQLNSSDCVADRNRTRLDCKEMVFEMPYTVIRAWNKLQIKKRSMTLQDYFTGFENLIKICILCEDFFEINFPDCYDDLNGGKQSCMNYVKSNRGIIEEGWKTFAATEIPTGDQHFLPENLAKTCKICDDLFQLNSSDCVADRNRTRLDCKEMVFEMPNTVAREWNKLHIKKRSTDDSGTEREIQKMCFFCDKNFQINYDDCVADSKDARLKCKKYVSENPKS